MPVSKIGLISGASRGLGQSMALHLMSSGVGVIDTYHQSDREARKMLAMAEDHGHRLAFIQLDVRQTKAYPDFVLEATSVLRDEFAATQVDYLVNNAGIGIFAPFRDTTPEQFDDLVEVNLKAPYFLTQAVLPLIKDGGRILNVSTALTHAVVAWMSAYAAVKGAVEVLTRNQAVELADRGIRVDTLTGGAVETDFCSGIMHLDDVNRLAADTIALGRIGVADDIGAAVPAILSERSSGRPAATSRSPAVKVSDVR